MMNYPDRWYRFFFLWFFFTIISIFIFLIANGYFTQYLHHVFTESQAIAIAKKAYGTGNGDYDWGVLYKDNDEYFVKAISRKAIRNGSMTGTAVSCMVKKNGTVVNNANNPFSN